MPERQGETMGIGYLIVEVSTASGALPIANATVTVDSTNGITPVHISVETDASGRTERLSLPTKAGYLSLSTDDKTPYSTYNIEVYASGYYPYEATNVPIFAGVTSLQRVRLIPLSAYDSFDVFPRGNTVVRTTEPLI